MAYIAYKNFCFTPGRLRMIAQAKVIISEYQTMGFDLTLRQLYYQFVARKLIENKDKEYKRLGSLINDARLAGEIDWNTIHDNVRNVERLPTWNDPSEIIAACASQYKIDRWDNQSYRVEVWIEKDALIGVIRGICQQLRVPCFACRGYVSQSEMHSAGLRFHRIAANGQTPILIHLGDHDPSGIDMSRDIEERLRLFMTDPNGGDDRSEQLEVERIALNMSQIAVYNPPPNPAKITDIRYEGYRKKFNTTSSWELDALNPQVIADLVRDTVLTYREEAEWEKSGREEKRMAGDLSLCQQKWDKVVKFVRKPEPKRKKR